MSRVQSTRNDLLNKLQLNTNSDNVRFQQIPVAAGEYAS